MKELPAVQGKSTDALFAVVRSEIGEFVRHAMFHLDFTSPALKPIFKSVQHGQEVAELTILENTIEDKYLKFCDPENPLHFMTIWWARAYLAKCRLMEHLARYSSIPMHPTDAQRDTAISHALRMLECDTKFMTSSLTKRFLWLLNLHFPAPAYFQILQDLRKRPGSELAEQAWGVMSNHYEARFVFLAQKDEDFFFKIFANLVFQAWRAREAACSQLGEPPVSPRIVSFIRQKVAQTAQNAQIADMKLRNGVKGMGVDSFPTSLPMGSGSDDLLYNMGGQDGYGVIGPGVYPNMPGQTPLDVDVDNLDWTAMDWGFGGVYPGVWDAEL
jgi:hypothetical protein